MVEEDRVSGDKEVGGPWRRRWMWGQPGAARLCRERAAAGLTNAATEPGKNALSDAGEGFGAQSQEPAQGPPLKTQAGGEVRTLSFSERHC